MSTEKTLRKIASAKCVCVDMRFYGYRQHMCCSWDIHITYDDDSTQIVGVPDEYNANSMCVAWFGVVNGANHIIAFQCAKVYTVRVMAGERPYWRKLNFGTGVASANWTRIMDFGGFGPAVNLERLDNVLMSYDTIPCKCDRTVGSSQFLEDVSCQAVVGDRAYVMEHDKYIWSLRREGDSYAVVWRRTTKDPIAADVLPPGACRLFAKRLTTFYALPCGLVVAHVDPADRDRRTFRTKTRYIEEDDFSCEEHKLVVTLHVGDRKVGSAEFSSIHKVKYDVTPTMVRAYDGISCAVFTDNGSTLSKRYINFGNALVVKKRRPSMFPVCVKNGHIIYASAQNMTMYRAVKINVENFTADRVLIKNGHVVVDGCLGAPSCEWVRYVIRKHKAPYRVQ